METRYSNSYLQKWQKGRPEQLSTNIHYSDRCQNFRKVIYDQLCDYLNDNNLVTHCQSGFRSSHSTLTALIEATNSWSVNIDNGLVNGVIFIDPKKAFDTIDRTILIRKLRKYGIDSSSLKWFESYLCDRNQKCSTNGHLSNTTQVSCGVTHKVAILVHSYF